jgi:hypothetical protein
VPPTLTCSSNASSLNGMPAPFSSCRIRLRLAGLARSASNTPRSFSVGHKHTHTHRTVARCRAHSATRFKSTGYVASVLGHKPRESVASGSAAASKQASRHVCRQCTFVSLSSLQQPARPPSPAKRHISGSTSLLSTGPTGATVAAAPACTLGVGSHLYKAPPSTYTAAPHPTWIHFTAVHISCRCQAGCCAWLHLGCVRQLQASIQQNLPHTLIPLR